MCPQLTPIERKRSLPQTINLESFAGLLAKLEREIERLFKSASLEDVIDHAFNCALTANHLLDWAWAEFSRLDKSRGSPTGTLRSREDLRNLVVSRFPDWVVLETIANASKHAGRPRKGSDVAAFPSGILLGTKVPADWDGDLTLVDRSEAYWPWGADLIVDGARQLHTGKLFPAVLQLWKDLATDLNLSTTPAHTERTRRE